jgi:hypothetical protein
LERADEKVLSALASLQGHADFEVIKQWIIASRDEDTKTMLITKDEVSLRWLQGSVQTLNAILEVGDKAAGIIHRKRTET